MVFANTFGSQETRSSAVGWLIKNMGKRWFQEAVLDPVRNSSVAESVGARLEKWRNRRQKPAQGQSMRTPPRSRLNARPDSRPATRYYDTEEGPRELARYKAQWHARRRALEAEYALNAQSPFRERSHALDRAKKRAHAPTRTHVRTEAPVRSELLPARSEPSPEYIAWLAANSINNPYAVIPSEETLRYMGKIR